MRVLMTGGGTAGHVNPAIAIANTIKEFDKESEIAFVCSTLARDKAQDLVPRAGYELYKVDIRPSYAIWNPKNILTLCSMVKSKGQAKKLIKDFKPDIIVGTGGFACYPVLNAGAEMGIPTVVHESNAIPGRAVKKLAPKVDVVMINFESSAKMLENSKRIMHVGNPQVVGQKTSGELDEVAKGYEKSVLIFGGSLGAETLNRAVADMLVAIADKYSDTEFYHAAGKRDFEELKKVFAEKGLDKKANVKLVDYIYDMDARMRRADLVISRAGAMTISELSLLHKAAILVPSPYVAANHQYKNAKALYDKGACYLVEESEFESGKLLRETEALLGNAQKRAELEKNIIGLAKPDANRVIYDEIRSLAKK